MRVDAKPVGGSSERGSAQGRVGRKHTRPRGMIRRRDQARTGGMEEVGDIDGVSLK
jgi:hypothetical protein